MNRILLCSIILFCFACKKNKDNNTNPTANRAYDSVFKYNLRAQTGFFSTITGNDRNIVMMVNTLPSYYNNIRQPAIYKFSQSGSLLWQKIIMIPDTAYYGPPRLSAICETQNGDYLLCGTSYRKTPYNGSFVIGADIALLKTNSNGDVLWLKSYGGDNDDYGTTVLKTSDGNYLIAGKSMSFPKDYYNDIYLVKIDANGNILWTKNYDAPEQQHIADIIETANGNFFLHITDNYGTGRANLMMLYADKNGNEIWRKRMAIGTNAHASAAAEAANGDWVLTYTTDKLHIVRIDKNGNLLWDKTDYTQTGSMNFLMSATSMKPSTDNCFTLAGSTRQALNTYSQLFLMKIDENGNQLLFKNLPGDYNHTCFNLLRADNGNNIITGNQTYDTTVVNTFFVKANDY